MLQNKPSYLKIKDEFLRCCFVDVIFYDDNIKSSCQKLFPVGLELIDIWCVASSSELPSRLFKLLCSNYCPTVQKLSLPRVTWFYIGNF